MRIQRVVARAFGPFQDETLELAPGLTVVAGPNESGKSSWHAALRAGICGVRRGKGRATVAESQFADRHRPWDAPARWEVEARLQLDDGRTIDIGQDLAGKVACRAVDVGIGRDVSAEIMDGTPDASLWLGLGRDAFAATICVSQGQIMSVTDAAELLQEHMQRAAATRGTDATAAEAIGRLSEFRRHEVGASHATARGPLRTAMRRVDEARHDLELARRRHDEYLDLAARADAAVQAVAAARRRVLGVELPAARGSAALLEARLARASELAARHPREPAAGVERATQADAVAAALAAWERRPDPVPLDGPDLERLEAELATIPQAPGGDLEPHPEVVAARRELDLALESRAAIGDPPEEAPAADPDAETRMRQLAARLRLAEPAPPPQLLGELDEARRARHGVGTVPAVGAAVVVLAGIAILLSGAQTPGLLLLVAGVAGAGVAVRRAGAARRRVAVAEGALLPYRHAADAARTARATATAEAVAAGLPAHPELLEEAADRLAVAGAGRRHLAEWQARRSAADARVERAANALAAALGQRGVATGDDLHAAVSGYEEACRARASRARAAERRTLVEQQIAARRDLELRARAASDAAATAQAGMAAAARAVGLRVPEASPARLAEALAGWRAEHLRVAHELDEARREWEELRAMLGGRSLDDLAEDVARATESVERLAAAWGGAALPDFGDAAAAREAAHAALEREQRAANELAGAREAIAAQLPDVAAAEEAVEAADAELDRVRRLDRTLEATLSLLRTAEQRVHRDLAPVLAEGIRRWLPAVSGGAYEDAGVDPADLAVRVKESGSGQWRTAQLLSEGTREQIYLLLRAAMAQHLVSTAETAPLLLDEVTAQSDSERTSRLLDVVRALSAERQVVLFTHDERVVAWAEAHLHEPADRLVRLQPRHGTPAQVALAAV